ncbi:MAG: hypothetical protein PWP03_64 [Candidatus Woesearchaeota archaeon]|nr:hypothetical protein [Candidatus Woesearchaeota archaeon]MDN5327426.1 hypothetical protein [Candidatus Woesearchaeota archaeon]
MRQYIADTIRELYRVEHLVYVSLKYTRTSDILKNIINRVSILLDKIWIALLELAKKQGKIEDYPMQPLQMVALVEKLYSNDDRIKEMIQLYKKIRKLNRAEFKAENEFRRQLKMSTYLEDSGLEEITIDSVTEQYKQLRDFVSYLKSAYFGLE